MKVDDADSWGWSEVRYPESMLLSDDLGGFVCLEELDDVDVEYMGDERTGRTVTFKVRGQIQPNIFILLLCDFIHVMFCMETYPILIYARAVLFSIESKESQKEK